MIKVFIKTDTTTNTGNLVGTLLDGKGRTMGMDKAIVTTAGSNAGTCFTVPVDRSKPDVEDIISTDSLLRRGEGKYMGGRNVSRTSLGWMGMDLIDKKAGIWKSHRYLSEV